MIRSNFIDEIFDSHQSKIQNYKARLKFTIENIEDGTLQDWETLFYHLNTITKYGSDSVQPEIFILQSKNSVSYLGFKSTDEIMTANGESIRGYKHISSPTYSAFLQDDFCIKRLEKRFGQTLFEYFESKSKTPSMSIERNKNKSNIYQLAKLTKAKDLISTFEAPKDHNSEIVFFGGTTPTDFDSALIAILQSAFGQLIPIDIETGDEILCDVRKLPSGEYPLYNSNQEKVGICEVIFSEKIIIYN